MPDYEEDLLPNGARRVQPLVSGGPPAAGSPTKKKQPVASRLATGAADVIGSVFEAATKRSPPQVGDQDFNSPFEGVNPANLPPGKSSAEIGRQAGEAARAVGQFNVKALGETGRLVRQGGEALANVGRSFVPPARGFYEGLTGQPSTPPPSAKPPGSPQTDAVGVHPFIGSAPAGPSDPGAPPELFAPPQASGQQAEAPPPPLSPQQTNAVLQVTGIESNLSAEEYTAQQAQVAQDPAVQKIKQADPQAQVAPSGTRVNVGTGESAVQISPVRVIRGTDQSFDLSWADMDRLVAGGPEVLKAGVRKMAELNAALKGEVYSAVSTEQIEAEAKTIEADAKLLEARAKAAERYKSGPNLKQYNAAGLPTGEVPNVIDVRTGLPAGVAEAAGVPGANGQVPPKENERRTVRDTDSGQEMDQIFIGGKWETIPK